eukprot:6824766-Prymnesium_polylepis.1
MAIRGHRTFRSRLRLVGSAFDVFGSVGRVACGPPAASCREPAHNPLGDEVGVGHGGVVEPDGVIDVGRAQLVEVQQRPRPLVVR